MSSTVFLPLLAQLLMSSLFVWDGILQLRNPGSTAQFLHCSHAGAQDRGLDLDSSASARRPGAVGGLL
jgi:hypothetical protein